MMISGYQIIEKLYESDNSLVYRGRREADQHPVILKVLRQVYPSPERIAWFKREYEITRSLNPAVAPGQALTGVVEAYGLEADQDWWVMVLEDFGGESLDRLGIVGKLALTEFLTLAIQVAGILGQVHQQHIMHKDVNPSNIVLNPQTGQVKLIDFGISTVLSRENPAFRHPEALEGTLAYMSPEQTGRMNRAMDYRTDLYSLGATFYELLTGQLPFPATDPLELLHGHIAKQPTLPHEVNPAIPQPISEMVMKLLAKNAEDRYQSAHGLKTDLEECLRQWQSWERVDPFPLGQHDVSDWFQLPQKLYGREAEIDTLLAAFERVSRGACEMMLVAGYTGIGKTALVQEVYRPITRQRGYFVSGKFDQLQRNIPYAALIQAFRYLIRLLLTESEVHIAAWREQLLAALGANGQVVIDVIPEVEFIIGPRPEVPILAAAEAQNRFNLVFQNFIRVFAQPEHPLVVFLDDLQWADGASLKLVQSFMTGAANPCLFLIGAYRDVEVSATHPLKLTLDEMQQAGVLVNHITLGPLDLLHVTQFVADTLHCSQEPGEAGPLAELVLSKTGGNPFFVGEFLKSLYAEGLIAFDHSQGRWRWDMERIRAHEVTDNVVDLMAGKVQQLGQPTQRALQLAACIGNRFDLGTLAVVHEESPRETAVELWAALAEGLVLPLSDAYKLMELEVEGLAEEVAAEYRFAHDRIQQAAYSLVPEADKQTIHWQVGQSLLQHTPLDEREQRIFDIVNQLNQGWTVSADQAERDELAELNLLAGKRAKASAAYEPAFNYLQVGLSLLGEKAWQRRYDLTLALHVEAAEAAYLSGKFEQMGQLAEQVLAHARTLLDKVKVYEVKIQALTIQAKAREALQMAFAVLKSLGVDLSEHPDPSDVARGLQETQAALAGKPIEDLIDLLAMTEPDKLAAMRILSNIMSPSHIAMPEIFPLLVMRQVNLSIQYGNSPISSVGYSLYGLILCGIVGDIEAGYRFGQLALRLLDKLNAREVRAMVVQLVAVFTRHWKEPLRAILPCLPEAYQIGLETGDLAYAGYSAHQVSTHSYFAGIELAEVEQTTTAYNAALANIKQETALQWNQVLHQAVLNLLGQADEPAGSPPCRLIGAVYDGQVMLPLHQQTGNRTGIFLHYFHGLILCYLFEAYPQAIENANSAEMYLDGVAGLLHVPVFYFYDSLARLAVWPALTPSEQKGGVTTHLLSPDLQSGGPAAGLQIQPEQSDLEKVAANQEKMKQWAQHAPANYLHKYYLVEAERARVLGNDGQAREDYDRAIDLARQNEYVNEEALAYELAARFYLARGRPNLAEVYLREAHAAYRRWGALAKVKDLEARYPQALAQVETRPVEIAPTILAVGPTVSRALDLASVMKATQSISSEIVLDKLLARLIEIVIENAGAQRGCLIILDKGGQWVIEAEGTVGGAEAAVRPSIPVDTAVAAIPPLLPATIVNYVAHMQENVVLNDAVHEAQFAHDPYIMARQPKSVLCMPLLYQGKLIGMLYLENNLATHAFTADRLEVLRLLSGQMAVSLENARLYDELESRVQDRTAELSKTNVLLKQEIAERKQAEEALRESQAELAAIFDHVPIVMILVDRERRVRKANRSTLEFAGRSAEEMMGLRGGEALRCLHSLDDPGGCGFGPFCQTCTVRHTILGTFETGKSHHQVEASLPFAVGGKKEELTFLVSTTLHDVARDQMVIVCIEDITERKRAEEALRTSEEKFRQFFENEPEYCYMVSPEGVILDVNSAALKVLGYRKEEVVGKPLVMIYAPESLSKMKRLFARWRKTGYLRDEEMVVTTKEGDKRTVLLSASVVKDREGEIRHSVSVQRDVTERKRVEEELGKYRDHLEELVEERTAELIRVNEQLQQEIAERKRAEEELRQYRDQLEGLVEERTAELMRAVEQLEREITERRRAEEQLQRYATELEQANEEVKRFAYIVSHDLRAPLTNLKGFAEELHYGLEVVGSAMDAALPHLDGKQQQAITAALQADIPEALGFIDSSVIRMDHFIGALLELSRLGRRELNLEPIDMEDLVQATLETLTHQIEERQVKVIVGPLPEVVADRTSMEQIVGNILDNAVKYLDPGRPGKVEITGERGQDETTFRVRDNGRGIAEEDMDKVFAPFRRAGRQDVLGEGMGLAYVQALVRRHGGRIGCESELGVGTTLTFTLSNHLTEGGDHV